MREGVYGLSYRTHLLVAAYGGAVLEQMQACRALGLRVGARAWTP